MRLLLLISNIVIGASLLAGSGNADAAKTKAYKQGKGKRHAVQAKQKIVDPGNVWRRISAGLRLPRPDAELAAFNAQQAYDEKYRYLQGSTAKLDSTLPATTLSDAPSDNAPAVEGNASAVVNRHRYVILPTKAEVPKDKYTELGRKLLNSASAGTVGECDPNKGGFVKSRSARLQNARVRAQFDFYPELHKRVVSGAKIAAHKTGFVGENPCAAEKIKKMARLISQEPVTDMPKSSATVTPAEAVPASKLDAELQLLAAKQRDQEAQRSEKLLQSTERVNKFVNWYAQRQGYLYEVSERAKPYLYHIVDALNKQHLPLDLALLPIVESAYQPTALSPMSAAGLWQFIPSTGAEYNLKQDVHYDERLDITASTQAAVSYLGFLNRRFKGDWLLALAAYNAGIGRVEDAMARNRAEGLDTDYWSLVLPEETMAYVPRLLALSKLMSNPAAYNLKMTPVKDEPYFIAVDVDRTLDKQSLADKELKTIAEFANVPYEQFALLNPGYLEATLPPDRPFNFLMPIANANQLYQRLSLLVKGDEPINSFKLILPEVNKIADVTRYAAPYLSLPVNDGQAPIKPDQTEKPKQAKQYQYLTVHYVDKGETLLTVAKAFDVSVEAVRALNKLKRKQGVSLGQRLTIPSKQVKTIMLEASNSRGSEAG